jgi:iron complex outermembrane recepter protein
MVTRQKAVFGELNVDVVEGLQATVGLRAFEVTQSLHTPYSGVFNGGTTEMFGSSKDTGLNPKFGLSYHWSPQVLTYVSAAKGFRQGGPLPDVPSICASDLAALGLSSAPSAYEADTLWNYELGAKTEWLDGRLTLNGSVYYMDWSEVQQLVQLPTCGFVFTGNFGKAVSKGSELEILYEPVPALQLMLGVAYNHAELRATVPGAQGSKGDTLQNAPEWIGSASAEYQRDLGPRLSGYLRLDFSTTSRQFNNFDSTSLYYERAGYSLVNARVGVERDAWEASIFINNVLDKAAETALPAAYGIDLPTTRRISLNRPRTIGLEVQHRF